MSLAIEPIPSSDELGRLLEACDLLFSDIGSRGGLCFFGCRDQGKLVGAVGLELYGDIGLLRSLAVDPRFRGKGLGQALVQHVEAEARLPDRSCDNRGARRTRSPSS